LSGDFGLLHALDERVAVYGFETNTGVKFVAIVDMRGRRLNGVDDAASEAGRGKGKGVAAGMMGIREGEMKVVCLGQTTRTCRIRTILTASKQHMD
jgi:hypothetical protein